MDAGADDYLIKPFSAKELLARVGAHLRLAHIRHLAAAELNEREVWLRGQREALEAALIGGPLDRSLSVLIRTATSRLGRDVRAAFYMAGAEGKTLHLIVGMSPAYAEAVEDFKIRPESLAGGLAAHTGRPMITADVMEDPVWEPWRWLAEQFDYRGCWSFPVHTTAGKFVGSLAFYFRQPRQATPLDVEYGELITQTAAIIIARFKDGEDRRQIEQALLHEQQTAHARLEQEVASRTQELELRVAERDALLKEVHHRVKNNLQVVTGMLEMQARRSDDYAVFNELQEACNRVMSIAQIHEMLDQSTSFSAVNLTTYAGRLMDQLLALYQQDGIRTAVRGENINVALEQAVACGLLLNELVSNACKHGFPEGKHGNLTIHLARNNGSVILAVEDTGVGLPSGFELRNASKLGFTIVQSLTTQLRGRLNFRNIRGLRVEVEFPASAI